MDRRIAVKRLTASDLTLFAWQFQNQNVGNQKAINLNADVFVAELFPALPEFVAELKGRIPLDLSIYGPGHAGLHNLQRKILKGGAYKNWRLNGEFINNPEGEPQRYDVLRPGDLAVFEFSGRIAPTAAKMILVSQTLPADRAIYARLVELLGDARMSAVSAKQLQDVAEGLEQDGHPFYELTIDAELEDAALGGVSGRSALWRPAARRRVTRDDIESARQRTEEVGRLGEELVFAYLDQQKAKGVVTQFEWESDFNAVAPYDFLVMLAGGEELQLDVKSTSGEFDRPMHISLAELIQMTLTPRYDFYRVFECSEKRGKIRIMERANTLAAAVLDQVVNLPAGVQVDSISVRPSTLPFGPPIEFALEAGDPVEEAESDSG